MQWVARRDHAADVDSAPPADGLDALSWDALCRSAVAAYRGDAEAHVAPLLRREWEAPHDTRVGLYLWYLLRYRVAELVGRKPSPEDLHALAERFYPKFDKLIRGDQRQLEDTMLSVFALAAEGRKVTGGNAVVMGTAALGVLLDDPEVELVAMRPHLANWWAQNAAAFGEPEVDQRK
jgi:hypothetical protein